MDEENNWNFRWWGSEWLSYNEMNSEEESGPANTPIPQIVLTIPEEEIIEEIPEQVFNEELGSLGRFRRLIEENRRLLQMPDLELGNSNFELESVWSDNQEAQDELLPEPVVRNQVYFDTYSLKFSSGTEKIKATYNHNLECCVCYNSEGLKTVSDLDDQPLKINDINLQKLFNKSLDDYFIILGPCSDHATCISCLKRLALDFDNHMINQEHSFIRCCDISGCLTPIGIPTYFEHLQMNKILNEEEYELYYNHAEMYEFPGFTGVKCPSCDIQNIIPNEKVRETRRGELIVECAQSCYKSFCFYCKDILNPYYTRCCTRCINTDIMTDQNRLNEYFYKLEPDKQNSMDILYKNSEITESIVLFEFIEFLDEESGNCVSCPVCFTKLYKTEQCNSLDHCKVEICNACGKIGDKFYYWKLGDHWSERGNNGCPRYDYAPYWNDVANCNFTCDEKICYNHEVGDCKIEEHSEGVFSLKKERCKRIIYHKLKSLLKPLRDSILEKMKGIPLLEEYIPKDSSCFSDIEEDTTLYNHYSPEIWKKCHKD